MPQEIFQDPLFSSIPSHLQEKVTQAQEIETASQESALQSLSMVDHTSLSGQETEDDIVRLCNEARGTSDELSTAAICIYGEAIRPGLVALAKEKLQNTNISIAVVNAFPCPQDFSADEIYETAIRDLAEGADEIDTVFDVKAFKDGKLDIVRQKLSAVRRAIDEHNDHLGPEEQQVILKTILNASAFDNYDDLYGACKIALDCGADYLKTSTGKGNPYLGVEKDTASLPIATVLIQAVADYEEETGIKRGIKIAGGIGKIIETAPIDTQRYKALMHSIAGRIDMRFGASGNTAQSLRNYGLGLKLDPGLSTPGEPSY